MATEHSTASATSTSTAPEAAPRQRLTGPATHGRKPAGALKHGPVVRELKGHDTIPPKDKQRPARKAVEAKTPRVTIEGNNGALVIGVPKGVKKDDLKELRGESKRGKLLESLQHPGGITMGQATTRFEWKPRDFADALRLLAKVNGISTKRDEKGHWHVAK